LIFRLNFVRGESYVSNLLRPITAHEVDAPSLELTGVSVRYEQTLALDDVSLLLHRGDRVAIVGPNGAGKSTLFNVVAGVLKPDRGAVRIYGSDPAGHVCVGYVPQRSRIDLRFPATVWDVVMMGRVRQIGLFRWPSSRDAVTVRRALRQVGMESLAKRHIGELSGGQQQRVLLARALAQGAELLLMDEPLTGLDAPSQRTILEIIDQLTAEGVTVLFATHDLAQAQQHFPLLLLLNRHVVAFGPVAAVMTTENLLHAYGGQTHVLTTASGALLVTDTCCGGGEPVAPAIGVAGAAPSIMSPPAAEVVAATRPLN
jgi:manganese/iron transport system ATP-binding protein